MKFGIGQAVTRIEDDRLLTGRGRYADDIDLPGALHLALAGISSARLMESDDAKHAA